MGDEKHLERLESIVETNTFWARFENRAKSILLNLGGKQTAHSAFRNHEPDSLQTNVVFRIPKQKSAESL